VYAKICVFVKNLCLFGIRANELSPGLLFYSRLAMDMHRFSAICVLLAYLRERHSYPGEKRFEEIREFA